MRQLFHLIGRFRADERGVFAMMFGLIAVVLIAMAGAVVDFASLQQARNRAQIALDAAALALQPEIFRPGLNEETLRGQAEALLIERLGDERITATVDRVRTNIDEGSITLEARLQMPTIFIQLVGVDRLGSGLTSEALRRRLALEVVMVLDNSGSMAEQNRMSHLQQAARCASNILFFGDCTPAPGSTADDSVKVGLVPFTSLVNVGAGNRNQPWLDRSGAAPKTRDNFDNDDDSTNAFTAPFDRIAVMDQLANSSWKGCVEARAYPHSVSDTTPTAANPATLFTPAFAPDEPGNRAQTRNNFFNSYLDDSPPSCDRPPGGNATCTQTLRRTGCNASMSNCAASERVTETEFAGPRFQNVSGTNGRYVGDYPQSCDCRNAWTTVSGWVQRTGSGNNRTFEMRRSCGPGYIPTGLEDRELQERLCKYTGASIHVFTDSNAFFRGPNADCPNAAILPLTDNTTAITNAIGAMRSEGGTNIHQGGIWGYHVLTPGQPFNQALPFDDTVSKVMILMTDGENTFYTRGNMNNAYFLQAYGYPYNQREGNMSTTNASMATRMNALLLETCTNAKRDNILIYTIGLATGSTTNPNTVRQMLRDCASNAEWAYFPNQPSELTDVFASIANQLAQLRLAR